MREYELLLAPFVGWACAQGIKFVTHLRKDGFQLSDLYASGGFPSSHTAFIVPLVVLLGLRGGISDPVFALSGVVAALIMYDAVGVRRSSGEQGAALKELAAKSGKKLTTRLHVAKGHTPVEVVGGVVLGILVGFGFYLLG